MPKQQLFMGGGKGVIEVGADTVDSTYASIEVDTDTTLDPAVASYYAVKTTLGPRGLTLKKGLAQGTWFQVANEDGANPITFTPADPAETINGMASLEVAGAGVTQLVKATATDWNAVFQASASTPATPQGLVATASQYTPGPTPLLLSVPTTLAQVTVDVAMGQSLIIDGGAEYDVNADGAQTISQSLNVGIEGDIDTVGSSTTGPSELVIGRTVKHTPSSTGSVTVMLTAKYQLASDLPVPAASNASLVVQVVDV